MRGVNEGRTGTSREGSVRERGKKWRKMGKGERGGRREFTNRRGTEEGDDKGRGKEWIGKQEREEG